MSTLFRGCPLYFPRALADTGAVTLDQNSLSGACEGLFAGTLGLSGGLDVTTGDDGVDVVSFLPSAPAEVPEPGTLALLSAGLIGIAGLRRRRQT